MKAYRLNERLERVRQQRRNAAADAVTNPKRRPDAVRLAKVEQRLERQKAEKAAKEVRQQERQRQEDSAAWNATGRRLLALAESADVWLKEGVRLADEIRERDLELRRMTQPVAGREMFPLPLCLTANEWAQALRMLERRYEGAERGTPTVGARIRVQVGILARLARPALDIDLEDT